MAKKASKTVVTKPLKKPVKAKAGKSTKSVGISSAAIKKSAVSKTAPAASSKGGGGTESKKTVSKPPKVSITEKKKAPNAKPLKEKKTVRGAKLAAPEISENNTQDKGAQVALPPEIESLGTKKGKKFEGSTEEETRWLELRDKHKNIKARPYRLSEVYEEKTPLEHKILGWGFILSVINDRLEVLFRSGIKHLISNYKTNS